MTSWFVSNAASRARHCGGISARVMDCRSPSTCGAGTCRAIIRSPPRPIRSSARRWQKNSASVGNAVGRNAEPAAPGGRLIGQRQAERRYLLGGAAAVIPPWRRLKHAELRGAKAVACGPLVEGQHLACGDDLPPVDEN